jgi:hypothetical protein
MPSPDRLKISAYLSPTENEALTALANQWGVSKSKAIGLAIVAASNNSKVPLQSAPTTAVESTVKVAAKLEALEESFGKLRGEHDAAIASINARLDALGTAKATKPRKPRQKRVQGEIVEAEPVPETAPPEMPALDDPKGWEAKQLAKRLGVAWITVNKHRNESDFPQWSATKDPDNLQWESKNPPGWKTARLFPVL